MVELVHGLEDLGAGEDFPERLLVHGPRVGHHGYRAHQGGDRGYVVARGRVVGDQLAHGGNGGLGDEVRDPRDVGKGPDRVRHDGLQATSDTGVVPVV